MTHWDDPAPIWFERDEDELVGTQRSGGRPMPRIRMADLFRGYTNAPGSQPVLVWKGEDAFIEAHYVHGPEATFHRPSDYDMLIFQYTGHAGIETEMGEFQIGTGHCLHIPAGVAYRVIGGTECRQMVVKLRKPVQPKVDPQNPYTETEFAAQIDGAAINGQPVAFPARQGKILEVTEFFGGVLEPIVIERDHARLVGAATAQRGRDISVTRIFDYFTGMTGKGTARAPLHYEGQDFRTDAYNTEGQQNGFHRGADDDELWFQFRGHALNETEWGNHELDPLEMGYVPRGIAHRITGGDGFLRFVLYFRHPMFPQADESSQHGHARVEMRTTSTKELPALAEARAKAPAPRSA
jgi:mannose-6-phosphate isomerase-like protein (cupin superfamily)